MNLLSFVGILTPTGHGNRALIENSLNVKYNRSESQGQSPLVADMQPAFPQMSQEVPAQAMSYSALFHLLLNAIKETGGKSLLRMAWLSILSNVN